MSLKPLTFTILVVFVFSGCGRKGSSVAKGLGEVCGDGSECVSEFCKEGVCSECEENTDCPGAQECTENEDLGYYVCLGGNGELGDPCTDGTVCASGFCKGDVCSLCEENTDCAGAATCEEDTDLGYFVCTSEEEKSELGEPCTDGTECASGFCKESICSLCEQDNDCAGEMLCEEDPDLGYYTCQGGDGELGDPCTDGTECASGFCKEEVCSECEEDSDCDGALTCEENTDLGYYICLGGTGGLGTICTESADCASGYCYETDVGPDLCSECETQDDCPGEQVCRMNLGETYATCQDTGGLGDPCTDGGDCESGYCYERPMVDDVCSECETNTDCPTNQVCVFQAHDGYASCR